jgi:hypothetical protein
VDLPGSARADSATPTILPASRFDSCESVGAWWIALDAGLQKDGIATLGEGVEGRVFADEALGGGARGG